MLVVKTFLSQSTIPGAGLGCFAAEFIPKDSLIWEYNPNIDRRFSELQYDCFTDLEKEFVNTYAYKHDGYYYLCVDNGRYFNHSEDPNTAESLIAQKTYAVRDIQQGEEILSDYRHFGVTDEDYKHNVL